MTDAIKWLQETARFIHADRPDIFKTTEDAFEVLSAAYSDLCAYDGPAWQSVGGFLLHKHVEGEDDALEFTLTKKISSIDIFPQENVVHIHSWTENSGVLKTGVDLPSPML